MGKQTFVRNVFELSGAVIAKTETSWGGFVTIDTTAVGAPDRGGSDRVFKVQISRGLLPVYEALQIGDNVLVWGRLRVGDHAASGEFQLQAGGIYLSPECAEDNSDD